MATLTPTRPSSATWLHTPRRVWLRRTIFQIHLWLGLLVTLYAIVIGVSGSALVFKDQIERRGEPQLYHLHGTSPRLPLSKLALAAETRHPGWTVSSFLHFSKPDEATILYLRPSVGGPASLYRFVSVDPWTGAILADHARTGGIFGWLADLHLYLLAGPAGLKISGWFALALLLVCLTGVVIWWPGLLRVADALLLHRRRSWRRFNWDLHSVVGFWTAGWLIVLTITGLYFAFPKPVRQIVLLASGSSLAESRKDDESPRTPATAAGPLLSLDQISIGARDLLSPDAPPDYLALPAKPGEPWYVTGYYRDTAPYSQLVNVTLDPHTGYILSESDTRKQPRGARILQYFFAVHFGSFAGDGVAGFAVRLLWVVLGFTPALLACTGMLMFWNRKLRPLLRSRRRVRTVQ